MIASKRSLTALSFAVGAFTLALAPKATAATDTYTFRDKLQSAEGGANGNTLVPTFNNGALINGSYVDVQISASACANTPTVRGYSFPAFGGLKSLNIAPVVASESYTISMIVKFSPLRGGYTRLIDFSNSTLDDGIYVLNNGVSFYPVGTFAPNSFVDDQFSVMTITRNAATSEVALFIGLTPAGTYVDVDKRYVPSAGNLHFFMDNTTGSASVSESSPGVVTFLRVSDQPTTPLGLQASIDQACTAVACGNNVLEASEGCDDGNNVDGDGCSKTCKVENSKACNATAPGTTGAASCASGICDAVDTKCGYANGAGSTCDAANGKTVCRSGACGAVSGKCVPVGGCFVNDDCASKQCNTATFTCVGGPEDAGNSECCTSDATTSSSSSSSGSSGASSSGGSSGASSSSSSSSSGTLPASNQDGASTASCTCSAGPKATNWTALGLFALGLSLAIRRRVSKR
jgi:MYXO-CTERM domain-containing protein